MGTFVDFKKVKAQVGIEQVLDMLGVKHLKRQGDALRGQCPCCLEGGDRAFVATIPKNSFYCFSEKKGGDVIELAARFYRISQKEAADRIHSHFGLRDSRKQMSNHAAERVTEEVRNVGFDARAYQASLDPAHAALKDCGIGEQTIRHFDGGYCSRGLNRGRLVLPIQNMRGSVLAFMGLALKGEKPGMVLPKGFEPPDFFNLHRVEKGTLFLARGPWEVLEAWDAQRTNIVCPLLAIKADTLIKLAELMQEQGFQMVEF